MAILITGAAGFIGASLGARLSNLGQELILIDRFSDYYSVDMKRARAKSLLGDMQVREINLASKEQLKNLNPKDIQVVIHLAAQPGVRTEYPSSLNYLDDNVAAFSNILHWSLQNRIPKFMYASSSSVYGNNKIIPFHEETELEIPQGLYPRTKYFNELIATNYASNNITQLIGLRFFSVYGPWGRPDMAPLRLISSALNESEFNLLGDTNKKRDFTFIEDVVESVINLMNLENWSKPVLNIGGGNDRSLQDLINIVESISEKKISVQCFESDARDLNLTLASNKLLRSEIGFSPTISLEDGISKTITWAQENNLLPHLRDWCS